MLLRLFNALTTSWKLLRTDKTLFILSVIPILMATILYALAGKFLYSEIHAWGTQWVAHYGGEGSWQGVLSSVFVMIFSITYFFIVQWTFLLIVSILAGPFHDAISNRVEKLLLEQTANGQPLVQSFRLSYYIKMMITEVKKVVVIIFFTFMAILLSFFPLFAPIGIIITALLMSVQFLDYTWSRHDFRLRDCVQDIRRSFVSYGLSGLCLIGIMSIPIVNAFFLPVAVVFYTVLWVKKQNPRAITFPH